MARSRAALLRRLTHLAAIAVPGTLVEVVLRCGTASCACHRDPARRHRPPRAQAAAARRAVQAWRALWDTSMAVGHLNRQALRTRLRRKPGAAAGR